MEVRIDESWRQVLQPQFDSSYFGVLADFVRQAYQNSVVYPPAGKIFEAFNRTPFDKVKIVILGQDPYHEQGQAHGLSFSVKPEVEVPPSLVNIYRELSEEYQLNYLVRNGDLSHWADQGVLLLNATLTVQAGRACSHQGKGWETFTDAVIETISQQREHVVFMLWGNYARQKKSKIDATKHLVLEAPHPSPLSAYRGFIGCGHFKKANEYLQQYGFTPIAW